MAVLPADEEELFAQRRRSSSLSSTAGADPGSSVTLTARDRIRERLKRSNSKNGGEGTPRAQKVGDARGSGRLGRVDDYKGVPRRHETGGGSSVIELETTSQRGGSLAGPARSVTLPKQESEAPEVRGEEREEKRKKKHRKERDGGKSAVKRSKESQGSESVAKESSQRPKESGKTRKEGGNVDFEGKASAGSSVGAGTTSLSDQARESSRKKERKVVELIEAVRGEDITQTEPSASGKSSDWLQGNRVDSSQAPDEKGDVKRDRSVREKTRGESERRRRNKLGISSGRDGSFSEGPVSARRGSLLGDAQRLDSFTQGPGSSRHDSFSETSRKQDSVLEAARGQGSFTDSGGSTRRERGWRGGKPDSVSGRNKRPGFEVQVNWTPNNAGESEDYGEGNALSAFERALGAFPEPPQNDDVAELRTQESHPEIEEIVRSPPVPGPGNLAAPGDVTLFGHTLSGSPSCTVIRSCPPSSALSLWGDDADSSTLIVFPPWVTVASSGEPTYLPQDDGLFIVQRPRTRARNNVRMVNRLVHECRVRGPLQRWFVDGDVNQMRCLGEPLAKEMNRLAKRYNPEAPYLQYFRHVPSRRFLTGGRRALYRLDIELGRLEFLEHPLASREDILAGQLLAAFREYKKRERAGLAAFYADKVKALQASVDAARGGSKWAVGEGGAAARMPATLDDHPAGAPMTIKRLGSSKNETADVAQNGLTLADPEGPDARVAEMRAELREARELRDGEERLMRELVARMRDVYREVEEARQRQGFRTTVIQLIIKKEEPNPERDAARYEQDLRLLVDEAAAAHAAAAARDRAAWAEARTKAVQKLAQEEQSAREAREARRRLREEARERMRGFGEGSEREGEVREEQETEEEARARARVEESRRELEEMVPPEAKPFDERRAKKRAIKELRSSHYRQPGDPILTPLLVAGLPRDETNVPKPEVARRRAVGRCRVYARLIVNGHAVGQAVDCALRQDFSLDFRDVFTLQLLRWPESVKVQLWERALRDALIAEVFLVVPLPDEASGVVCLQEYQFTGSVPFSPLWPHNETAPNGAIQTVANGAAGYRVHYPSGVLHARVAWVDARDERDLENSAAIAPPAPPLLRGLDPGRHRSAIGGIGQVSPFQLAAWLRRTGLDPNDPRNAPVLELLRAQDACARAGRAFRLHSTEEELRLEGARASKRLALLKIRWNKSGVHSGVEVPLLESHVDDKMLDELAQGGALVRSAPSRGGPPETRQAIAALRATEERQRRIQDFLSRVQANVEKHKRLRTGVRQYKVDDVIKDTPLPEFKLNLDFLFHLLAPRRKLRPAKRPVKVLAAHPDRCEIAVYVQKAHNVPVRKDAAARGGPYAHQGGGRRDGLMTPQARGSSWDRRAVPLLVFEPEPDFSERVCPFVEVSFQGATKRTRASEGPNPQWNELVALPFMPAGGDFSPSALKNSSDLLRISVFDEVPAPPDEDDTNPDSQQEQPLQRRYLGSFSLLAGSIYQAGGVHGAFPVQTPPVNLGFKQLHDGAATLLTLYITLRPQLAVPQHVPEEAQSGEEEDLARYAHTWQRELLAMPVCKGRVIKALATDHEGAAIFLPRFVSPLAPPPALLDDDPAGPGSKDVAMRRLLRFVSMVPFVEDWAAFQSAGADVWMTCRDFLSLCAGDSEEHALTLCNYFLHSGWPAYVALGVGTQEAEAACVVTIAGDGAAGDAHDVTRVWNAGTGRVYAADDASCELRQVGVVFNEHNIWANVQPVGAPWEISWRLNDPRCWRPFFADKAFPHRDLGSVQVPIQYVSLPGDFYKELEACLEREVMDAITAARKLVYTHFNRRCSRILKELLRDLEHDALSAPLPQPPDVILDPDDPRSAAGAAARRPAVAAADNYAMLAPVLKNYDIVGFPLNLPFTDGTAVTDAVLSTHIQHKYHKDVEFAVATYVKPYDVSFVCSIWVYVAALTKK